MKGWGFGTSVFLSFVISIAASSCDGTTGPDEVRSDVSGVWDARFEGTVTGRGTSQTDDLSMELSQSGSSVTGSLRFSGLDISFPVSGTVTGNRFDYRSSVTLEGCELRLEARTVIDPGGLRFSGDQTQASCEGTATGRVEATKRR
jgi:hypothetical protein